MEQALFPLPSKAVLKAWTRVAEDGEMVRYEATLAHESNALKIDVTVSKGYPRVPPRFAVAMVANGSDGDANTSARDPNMDAMEREVNVHFDELAAATDPSLLLTLQLRRLQMCFDVYVVPAVPCVCCRCTLCHFSLSLSLSLSLSPLSLSLHLLNIFLLSVSLCIHLWMYFLLQLLR